MEDKIKTAIEGLVTRITSETDKDTNGDNVVKYSLAVNNLSNSLNALKDYNRP